MITLVRADQEKIVLIGGERINPKGGKVIQIDDKQLNKLYSYQQDSSYKGRSR